MTFWEQVDAITAWVIIFAIAVVFPLAINVLYHTVPRERLVFSHVPDKMWRVVLKLVWVPACLWVVVFVHAIASAGPASLFLIGVAWYAGVGSGLMMLGMWWIDKANAPEATATVTDITGIIPQLQIPHELLPSVTSALMKHAATDTIKDPQAVANSINKLATLLPNWSLIKPEGRERWGDYFFRHVKMLSESTRKADLEEGTLWWQANEQIPLKLRLDLQAIPIGITLPEHLRTQHMMVVAGSGAGKSQAFQTLIMDDLDTSAAIIVIDSQNDLINKLATRVPQDRLILIDAADCPPALNIFKLNNPGLLEYVFGALEAQMTSQQGMVYRYLARHVIQIDGTVSDLLKALQNPEQPYQPQNEAAAAFFAEYAKPKGQYREVREQISRRLLTLLENDTFERMLTAPDLSIDIPDAIEKGKIVLINTAKATVGGPGAALFGRFWLSVVLMKVMQGSRKPVRLYVDEFADYASDELDTIFTQSRKYNLAMTCAFQSLAQLPEKLKAVMLTNTAIKLVSSVSAEDRGNLARQMDCDPSFIARAKRGTFAAWFRDIGTAYYTVDFGKLERLPELAKLSDIHRQMRERYGPKSRPPETPPGSPSPPPVSPKNPDNGPPEQGRAGKRVANRNDEE